MRGVRPYIALGVVVALFLGVAVFFGYNSYQDRERQKAQFKADAVAVGFAVVPADKVEGKKNPTIEDEKEKVRGITRTVSTIELIVEVRGCRVELARLKGEKAKVTRVNRQVRVYSLDEGIARGGGEADIEVGTTSPMPADVEQVLTSDPRFTYCLNPPVVR